MVKFGHITEYNPACLNSLLESFVAKLYAAGSLHYMDKDNFPHKTSDIPRL